MKIRDYFAHTELPTVKDVLLLKVGRHFRLDSHNKIIVARNEQECRMLRNYYLNKDHLLDPVDFSGPVVILQGYSLEAAIKKLLYYTKRLIPENARIVHLYRGNKRTITLNSIFAQDCVER